jgi:hypothetical protein
LRRCEETDAAHYFCEVGDYFASGGNMPSFNLATLNEDVGRVLGV